MRPHLASPFIVRPSFQQGYDFLRYVCQGLRGYPDRPERLELVHFVLEMRDARRCRRGFELLKGGDGLVGPHD